MFLYLWDSQVGNHHWERKDWSFRTRLKSREKNVVSASLVPRDKIVFPPLHIKLELMDFLVKGNASSTFAVRSLASAQRNSN